MPTSTNIRLAVVEDSAAFRCQLVETLNSHPGWSVVAQCPTAEAALRDIPGTRPHLILMDLLLPGRTGSDVIAPLRASLPQTPIVMLTVVDSPHHIVQALEAGACGYILKCGSAADLLASVEEVLTGGATMSPAVARRLVEWFQQPRQAPHPHGFGLTEREWQVLRLASRGKQQGEISLALNIAVNTVKNHFRNIYEKLDVHSLADAFIKLNQGRNLLSPPPSTSLDQPG